MRQLTNDRKDSPVYSKRGDSIEKSISDIQSESGVIGTLYYHPDYLVHAEYLKPEHFVNKENRYIYQAIVNLWQEGIRHIDAYNVSSMIQKNATIKMELEQYNLPSMEEMSDMYKNLARHTVEEYKMLAETIVTLAFKRELLATLDKLKVDCRRGEIDLDTLNNNVYRELDGLTQRFMTNDEIHTLGEKIYDIWSEIVSRRTDDGTYGIPSKFKTFSEYFTYEPGELVVIQAKYKQGKSVFLMNEVVHKLKNGIPTLVIDSEMPTRLYSERLIAHLSGVEVRRIKNGHYNSDEEQRIAQCLDWIKNQPFVHIYDPNLTDSRLFSICKILQRKIGLQFVVYDYLKSNATSSSDNYNILGAKCDYLKNNIAGELDLAVLAACQLNRNDEVADSIKINRYLSVGIKWGYKTQAMQVNDGLECGNACAKIYLNRLGRQMDESDPDSYIDFIFDGDTMTIVEAKQHEVNSDI